MKNLAFTLSLVFLFQLVVFSSLQAQRKAGGSTLESCNSQFSFNYPRPNSFIRDSLFFVKINPKSPSQISSIDLYLDGKPVGRDMRAPFSWGKGSGLRGGPKYLKPGTHKLKAVVRDKCGKSSTQYATFKVRGNR